ncbi:MAG TPA: UpxY family transcription antiterminator [Candidatus Sulfotelmatobacter sp.]|nr:UpxY family transcription antiterminator [Candidatus Sulfotelmatobacter sp.]
MTSFSDNELPSLAAELEPRWYAVYTHARHEKKISEQLSQKSIEQFLPLYETVHRWKDRRVRLQLPLFPSYVFVRIALLDQPRVLETPGVVRLVSFSGKPVPLPDLEISALRQGLSSGLRAEPLAYTALGRRVRVKSGPLCGLTGKLVRRKENYRIVIAIESINRSILCEVSVDDVEAVGSASTRGEKTRQSPLSHCHDLSPQLFTGDFSG